MFRILVISAGDYDDYGVRSIVKTDFTIDELRALSPKYRQWVIDGSDEKFKIWKEVQLRLAERWETFKVTDKLLYSPEMRSARIQLAKETRENATRERYNQYFASREYLDKMYSVRYIDDFVEWLEEMYPDRFESIEIEEIHEDDVWLDFGWIEK